MADERTINLLIRAMVDKELSLQAAESILTLRDSIQSVQKAADSATPALEKIGKNADLQRFVDQLREAETELDKTKDKADALGEGGGSLRGVSGRGLGSAARLAGTLGAPSEVTGPLRIAGEIATTVGSLNRMSNMLQNLPGILGNVATEGAAVAGGMGALLAVAAPLAAAIVAIGVAFQHFNEVIKPSKDLLDAVIDSQKQYYADLEKFTSQQAKSEVEKLETSRKIQMQALNESNDGLSRLEKQTGIGAGVGISLPTALGDEYRKLTKQFDENKTAVTATDAMIGRLTGGIQNLAFAANDAAAAEEKYLSTFERVLQANVKRHELEATGTPSQVNSEIQRNQIAIEGYRKAILELAGDTTPQAQAATEKYKEEIYKLTQANLVLTSTTLPIVQARTDEAEAAKKLNTALVDIVKNNQELAKLDEDQAIKEKRQKEDEQRLADRQAVENRYKNEIAQAKEQEAISKAREDGAEKDQAAVVKYNTDAARIDADYMAKALKNVQNFNLSEQRLSDDQNKKKLRDVQDAQQTLHDLAAKGDVLAFIQAQQSLSKKLSREDQDFSDAEKRRHEDFNRQQNDLQIERQERLLALQEAFAAEQEKRKVELADRLKQIEESGKIANMRSAQLEAELNNIREQWRRDDLDRQHTLEQEDFQRRRNAYVTHGAELVDIVRSQFERMKNDALDLLKLNGSSSGSPLQIGGGIGDGISGVANGFKSLFDGILGIQSFDTGGDVGSRERLIRVHPYERVLTPSQNMAYMAGGRKPLNVTFNYSVGDIATGSQLVSMREQIHDDVVQAHAIAGSMS